MLFGSAKTKSKDVNKLFAAKAATAATSNDSSMDAIMSRNTFNEKDLIKKKEEVVVIAEVKEEKKKSKLDESDEDDDFFKKKKKKEPKLPEVPKVAPAAVPQKKKNKLFDSDEEDEKPIVKKTEPVKQV